MGECEWEWAEEKADVESAHIAVFGPFEWDVWRQWAGEKGLSGTEFEGEAIDCKFLWVEVVVFEGALYDEFWGNRTDVKVHKINNWAGFQSEGFHMQVGIVSVWWQKHCVSVRNAVVGFGSEDKWEGVSGESKVAGWYRVDRPDKEGVEQEQKWVPTSIIREDARVVLVCDERSGFLWEFGQTNKAMLWVKDLLFINWWDIKLKVELEGTVAARQRQRVPKSPGTYLQAVLYITAKTRTPQKETLTSY